MGKGHDGFELVLLVKEMANSAAQRTLRSIAMNGVATAMLGRKSSNWDKEIGPITRSVRKRKEVEQQQVEAAKAEKMAQIKSIPDSLLAPAIEAYRVAVDAGATEEELVQAMVPFFAGRPLTNWLQLKGYVQRTVETGRAPAAFLAWASARGTIAPIHELPAPPPAPVVSTVEESPPPPPPSVPTLSLSELTELYDQSLKDSEKKCAELLRTLEQERTSSREDIQNLKAKLKEEDVLLRRIAELEGEVSRFRALPPAPKAAVNLGKALSAFKTLIEQGLMTELEAFRQLMKLAEGS